MKFKLVIGISVVVLIVVTYSFMHEKKSEYVMVEPLVERLGNGYVKLHEIVKPDERLGVNEGNVSSPLYQKNEGWLLRNQTVYCSNRITDNIESISQNSGISKYAINPDGTRRLVSIEEFKDNLISLNELCVSEGKFEKEPVLEATLFIWPDHKIWRKNGKS